MNHPISAPPARHASAHERIQALRQQMAARRAARTPLPAWMQGRRPAGPATPRHQPALEGWA